MNPERANADLYMQQSDLLVLATIKTVLVIP